MKIAIVGSHPETWRKAPFDDEGWQIWGFSRRNYGKLPRCDYWFELHHPRHFNSYDRDIPGYTQWLKDNPDRMTYPSFPWEQLVDRFGPYFFSEGQISWIMAYAMLQEPETIGLWGVEAAGKYQRQRYEIWHFTTICRTILGIEVIAPDESDLLKPEKTYAYSVSPHVTRDGAVSQTEADSAR